jgi:1-deoxy-D-xylulose-5-phosphate reductoisomerase
VGPLTFDQPDLERFPTIQLAYDVLEIGGGAPAALNGANEILVDLFLKKKIQFTEIFLVLQSLVATLEELQATNQFNTLDFLAETNDISQAIRADRWGRDFAESYINAPFPAN